MDLPRPDEILTGLVWERFLLTDALSAELDCSLCRDEVDIRGFELAVSQEFRLDRHANPIQ